MSSDRSRVTVTFNDGEVKTYEINATSKVGGWLALEAAATGVLNLFNDTESYCVPIANIRDWKIETIEPAPAEESKNVE